MPSFKVIISGGGTGGHVFPAIAIANALKEKVKEVEILFVGAKGKWKWKKFPKQDIQSKDCGLVVYGEILKTCATLFFHLNYFKVYGSF